MPRSHSGPVAVITDSTAHLPQSALDLFAITSVPLTVVVDGVAFEDGSAEAAERLVPALRQHLPVTTSRPSPETFAAAYRMAAGAGAAAVVSIHLSAEISGTYDAAVLAAREAPVPVRVVDSGMIAMALGFSVLAAAEVVAVGGDADEAAAAAAKRAEATRAYFYVDTLDHLRRGGRINTAQALLGSALAVKPLLEMTEGRIELREKVRTAGRAIARLEELAVAHAGAAPVDVAVQHLAAEERAVQLAERLAARLPGLREMQVREVGAVLGAHTGPGLLGAIVAPR
jgi:DegV family protein with EDD domain